MNVTISGKHIDITDGLRDHIDGGLERFTGHFNNTIDVNVILGIEKHRHIAEINLHANGLHINAKNTSGDMYSSFDSALSKINKQIRKHKERINRHQPRTAREAREYEHLVIDIPFHADEHTETAVGDLQHKVIQRENVEIKHLTVEEAAMQLDLLHLQFYVFHNDATDKINVITHHDDGTYGLIEP